MSPNNNFGFEQDIRSAKPSHQPDPAFVQQLGQRLQQRAVVLADRPPMPREQKRSWWLWSAASLGAVTAVIASVVLLNPTSHITGYIQKGPFISGSQIIVQELTDQLEPTGTSYQLVTNSDIGDYALKQKIHSDYVEVIATGYYYNEVAGALSTAPLTLRTVAEVSDNQQINVNVLTTLIRPRINYLMVQEQKTFAIAKQQAEQEVRQLFHITSSEADHFEGLTINGTGENNGILLAISVLLQGQQTVAEVSELLSKLSLDLEADGQVEVDSALLVTLQTNASALNTHQIRNHLTERFTQLGQATIVPNFEQFLTPFISNADPLAYQITLLDNTFPEDHRPGAMIAVTIQGQDFSPDQQEVVLKNLFPATTVYYIDKKTITAEFPIERLTPGTYTVIVRHLATGRLGVTDGEPIEAEPTATPEHRLIIQGSVPTITTVTPSTVPYLTGGTIAITGENFAYGTFVWINNWQVPQAAIRVANSKLIEVDLSPALIANNTALPRQQPLTITVQTPDFQKAEHTGFKIQ